VDLPALCRKIVAEVNAATQQKCPIEFTAEVPHGQAHLDETLSTVILTNLLNNAVKYSSAGKPVHLSLRREGDDAVIKVCDQGIGIPAADQKELFKSFHRGTNVGDVPGSGLGLTIVNRCLRLHGGSISFESVEREGAMFTVRLPAFVPASRD
jgi:signal transduction histidine kinase